MKKTVLLILTAILSACASGILEKTVPEKQIAQTILDDSPLSYMSNQEKELLSVLNGTSFQLFRYNNILVVSLSGKDLFKEDNNEFSTVVEKTLQKIAPVLARYDKTRISIIAYVNSGNPFADRKKSEEQAQTITDILKHYAEISSVRFWVEGYNPETPVQTEEDFVKSNRVKIVLTPTFIQ